MKIDNKEMLIKYIMSKTKFTRKDAKARAENIMTAKFLFDLLAGKNICKPLNSKNRRIYRRSLKKYFDNPPVYVEVIKYRNPEWDNALVLSVNDSEEYTNSLISQLCEDNQEEIQKTTYTFEMMKKEDFENLPEWDG